MDTDMTAEIESLTPTALDQLERQLIAFLYAIWRAQGKSKRVVEIRPDKKDGNDGINSAGD